MKLQDRFQDALEKLACMYGTDKIDAVDMEIETRGAIVRTRTNLITVPSSPCDRIRIPAREVSGFLFDKVNPVRDAEWQEKDPYTHIYMREMWQRLGEIAYHYTACSRKHTYPETAVLHERVARAAQNFRERGRPLYDGGDEPALLAEFILESAIITAKEVPRLVSQPHDDVARKLFSAAEKYIQREKEKKEKQRHIRRTRPEPRGMQRPWHWRR